MIRDNAGDGQFARVCTKQRVPHQVHPAQSEIADGSHAKMLLAGGPERSFRNSDSRTEFSKINRAVGIGCQEALEARNDCVMAPAAGGGLYADAFCEAADHDM